MRESLKVADSQLDDEMIEQEVADYKSQSEQILKVFETAEKLVQVKRPFTFFSKMSWNVSYFNDSPVAVDRKVLITRIVIPVLIKTTFVEKLFKNLTVKS